MAKSVRYKDIRLYNYIEKIRIEEELQFCALCASINDEYEAIEPIVIGMKRLFLKHALIMLSIDVSTLLLILYFFSFLS